MVVRRAIACLRPVAYDLVLDKNVDYNRDDRFSMMVFHVRRSRLTFYLLRHRRELFDRDFDVAAVAFARSDNSVADIALVQAVADCESSADDYPTHELVDLPNAKFN